MSDTAPLRIAVLGVGRIGSAFAFQLAGAGRHEVTVIARPGSPRLRQLQRDEGIVTTKGERANVRILEALDEQTPYDLVIVTLLAFQVDSVLPALHRSAARCIQFMFVTFEPERLRDAVGAERCAFGMPFIQSDFDPDGRLKAVIGAGGQKTIMSQQRWVDVFTTAGLPAALEPDMPLWLRCHVPLSIAFEGISAAGVRRGAGASWAEALVFARGVHESYALIRALGHPIYPRTKARIAAAPLAMIAAVLWGMSRIRSFRDLLATGVNECRALVDVLAAAAEQAKPPVRVDRIRAMRPGQASEIAPLP